MIKMLQILENNSEHAERFKIGWRLDAVKYYYLPKEQAKAQVGREQKWVVFFPASGVAYESVVKDSKLMANALKANVLMFNYRGVSQSEDYPNSPADLVNDAAACFYHLTHDKRVPMRNFLAWGQSIGAGIAAEALAKEQYQEGHIVFDRSFENLPSVAEKFIPNSFLGSMAGTIIRRNGWVFDNMANMKNIKGAKIIANTEADGMIDWSISLACSHIQVDEEGNCTYPDHVVELEEKQDYTGNSINIHTKSLSIKGQTPLLQTPMM